MSHSFTGTPINGIPVCAHCGETKAYLDGLRGQNGGRLPVCPDAPTTAPQGKSPAPLRR